MNKRVIRHPDMHSVSQGHLLKTYVSGPLEIYALKIMRFVLFDGKLYGEILIIVISAIKQFWSCTLI